MTMHSADHGEAIARTVPDGVWWRNIWIIGDSHGAALQQALKSDIGAQLGGEVNVVRIMKTKRGVTLGDMDFPQVMEFARGLPPSDVIVSVVGGNHHQTFTLAQHPVGFRLLGPADAPPPDDGLTVMPRAQARAIIADLMHKELVRLTRLRRVFGGRLLHLFSPPPREHAEDLLRARTTGPLITMMRECGVSPAPLRMESWLVQCEVLREHLKGMAISFVQPPQGARSADGFLLREYQSDDATHANAAYGALALQKIHDELRLLGPPL